MSSTRSDTATIGIVVLRPVKPQPDGRRFQVFSSASKWPSLDEAVKWAEDRGIDRRFVLEIENREILAPDVQVEAVEPSKPHLLVFEDGVKRQVIGHFVSGPQCDLWSTAYFGRARSSKAKSYEILDPDAQDPNLESIGLMEYEAPNRGRDWEDETRARTARKNAS